MKSAMFKLSSLRVVRVQGPTLCRGGKGWAPEEPNSKATADPSLRRKTRHLCGQAKVSKGGGKRPNSKRAAPRSVALSRTEDAVDAVDAQWTSEEIK
jgi:hypothetical protein